MRLELQLLLGRGRWQLWLASCLLLAALGLQYSGVAALQAQSDETRLRLQQLPSSAALPAPAPPPVPLGEQRYEAFERTLCDSEAPNNYVSALFAEAAKQELVLSQGEYALASDKQGGYLSYQVSLPVRASYPQIRRLIDAVLAHNACAALADVAFKRDAAAAPVTEARLRFVFFLKARGA